MATFKQILAGLMTAGLILGSLPVMGMNINNASPAFLSAMNLDESEEAPKRIVAEQLAREGITIYGPNTSAVCEKKLNPEKYDTAYQALMPRVKSFIKKALSNNIKVVTENEYVPNQKYYKIIVGAPLPDDSDCYAACSMYLSQQLFFIPELFTTLLNFAETHKAASNSVKDKQKRIFTATFRKMLEEKSILNMIGRCAEIGEIRAFLYQELEHNDLNEDYRIGIQICLDQIDIVTTANLHVNKQNLNLTEVSLTEVSLVGSIIGYMIAGWSKKYRTAGSVLGIAGALPVIYYGFKDHNHQQSMVQNSTIALLGGLLLCLGVIRYNN